MSALNVSRTESRHDTEWIFAETPQSLYPALAGQGLEIFMAGSSPCRHPGAFSA